MIGLIVLAHFLSPADYGIMVISNLVIGIIEVFFFTSADTALLRDSDASDSIANSAWTLRLIQAIVVSICAITISPFAGKYFSEPRVVPVMIALGIGLVISALTNIGPVISRKNLEFGIEVRIGIASKMLSFIATIIAAYQLRSYWALVIGAYAGHLAQLFLSYLWHPFRPRWELKLIGRLWGFSQWLLISGIGSFLGQKSDELILGRLGSSQALGIYNIGSELGQTPTVEISAPVNRSLFPVLSSMRENREGSISLFFSTLGIVNTITIPVGIGMSILAEPFTTVALGSMWSGVIPILEIFALQGIIRFLVSPYYVWFMVVGKSKILAVVSWLDVIGFLVIAFFIFDGNPVTLAKARLLSTAITSITWVGLGMAEGLKLFTLIRSIYRPSIAGGLMALCLWQAQSIFLYGNSIIDLFALVSIGVLSFTTAIVFIWFLSGKPDGVEKWVINKVASII